MVLSGLGRVTSGIGAAGVSARVPASRHQQLPGSRAPHPSSRTSLEVLPQARSVQLQEQPHVLVGATQPVPSELSDDKFLGPFLSFQRDVVPEQPAATAQPVVSTLEDRKLPQPPVAASVPHSSPAGQLPEKLSRLLDPSQPVSLPAAHSVPLASLDNWKLDKLVSTLGRNRATWRRCLHLYEWLKEAGHQLDDRLCTTLIRVCADHGDSLAALGIYDWMCSPRSAGGAALSPTTYTYTAAMRASLSAGLLDRAMGVWEDAMKAPGGMVPDCRLCITYIETCTRLRQTDKALAMYSAMRDAPAGSAMAPSVHAYTAAMRSATEGGRWQKALDIWQDMKTAGCVASGHAYAAAISACACGTDWVRAVSLFEEMTAAGISPDVVSCTSLITALAAGGEADRAQQVVDWMLSVGLKPNVRTYTALLTALGAAQQWGRAVDLLWNMQQPQWGAIQPNAYTYSALLKSLGEHGQWELAEAVFSHLEAQLLTEARRSGAAPVLSPADSQLGHKLRTALTEATAAAAQRQQQHLHQQLQPSIQAQQRYITAQAMQHVMQPQASPPSASSPSISGARPPPLNWTSPAHLNGISFDLSVPNSAAAYANRGGGPQALPSAPSAVVVPGGFSLFSSASEDAMLSQTVASTGVQRPQWVGQPNSLLSQPGSSTSSSGGASSSGGNSNNATLLASGSPLFQTLSQISASLGDQLSHMSVSDAVASPLYDSSSTASAAASHQRSGGGGVQRSGSGRSAPRVASARPENRIVNEVVCGALMLAYERAGKWLEAVTVLMRALGLGIAPNTVMYNTAISAAGKAGELDLAERLFGLAPTRDAVTYETLIAAYGMAGAPQRAEVVLRSMRQSGLRPRDFAYCGLVAAYSLAGDCDGALRVRKYLRQDGSPMTTHIYNALLAACERAGQYAQALQLFQQMQRDQVEANMMTQQLMITIGRQGAQAVEGQQMSAAALSAALAAAGAMVMQVGAF